MKGKTFFNYLFLQKGQAKYRHIMGGRGGAWHSKYASPAKSMFSATNSQYESDKCR